jgi:hypothetical protein
MIFFAISKILRLPGVSSIPREKKVNLLVSRNQMQDEECFIFKMIDDKGDYILRIQSPFSGIPEREIYWEVLLYGNRQLLSYVNIINSVYGLSPSIESYILYVPKGFNS